MKRIRLWKLKRELRRALPKTLETLAEPFRYLTFVPLYDFRKSRLMRVTQGALPQGREIAVYLIFAPDGVQGSHLHMLSELARAGISPLVVSNLPLSDADRASLCACAWRVIERPNVGYDFGGYRDGILSIADLLPTLDRLWILNDSAWLVDQTPSWFDEARAMGRDFAGSVSNYGIAKIDIQDHTEIVWQFNPAHRKFHYVSNGWCIGAAILRDPAFLRFWKRLQIRHSKQLTVRRGEIGFSQWVIRRGFSHGATLEIDRLDAELAALDPARLDEVARHLMMIDVGFEPVKAAVLALDPATETGRRARITLCLTAVARFGTIIAMPFYNQRFRRLPFFKKSVFSGSPQTVQIALDTLAILPGENGHMILSEARALAQAKGKLASQPEDAPSVTG
ncbi:rhamnan synthesis F family protein [Seohaeicola saemankumensis]|uniref:rhamnan synthesis F family protein n=1 Tax=Seohaeicola TaxID=481178 RepID=UPI0035CECA73